MQQQLERKSIKLAHLYPTELSISFVETDRKHHSYQIDRHCHDRCEIYVNLSGDVSFMVEDTLYPVSYGEAIVTRPWEHHHCVYLSDRPHAHYWFLFSAEGSEALYPHYFDRLPGERNRISPRGENKEHLVALCRSLYENQTEELKACADFFALQSLLAESAGKTDKPRKGAPAELEAMLECIRGSFPVMPTVEKLASVGHVSVSTGERLFRQHIGMTPMQYMKEKRLEKAMELLAHGMNVTETAMECGFCDSSYFILQFRKRYGITPSVYRKKASIPSV